MEQQAQIAVDLQHPDVQRRPTRQGWQIWAKLWPVPYILPAFLLVGLVYAFPLVQVANLAFRTAGEAGGALTTANFSLLFDDPTLGEAAQNNLTLLIAVPVATCLALVLAILLYERTWGWRFYRSLIFVPYILAIPLIGILFALIYGQDGPLNEVLRSIGLGDATHQWLGDPSWALFAILAVIVWKELGFGVLLFSAGLANADEELYDAAKVDGASWLKLQRHVTVPHLAPIIEFFVVIEAITMLSWVFGYVFTMTRGGPGFSTYVMEFLIWNLAFVGQNRGLASAAALLLLVGAGVLIVLLRFLLRWRLPSR